jgi:hypothetical protein
MRPYKLAGWLCDWTSGTLHNLSVKRVVLHGYLLPSFGIGFPVYFMSSSSGGCSELTNSIFFLLYHCLIGWSFTPNHHIIILSCVPVIFAPLGSSTEHISVIVVTILPITLVYRTVYSSRVWH